mgnify:CR=1 FL=1
MKLKTYLRHRKTGNYIKPYIPRKRRKSASEKFEELYIPVTESGCWIWMGTVKEHGYGVIGENYKNIRAHRLAYEKYRGPIPKGLVLDHLCRVPSCVNPWHLEPVTDAENFARGRHPNREKTHCKNGHPLSGENLYIYPENKKGSVRRSCKTCRKEYKIRFMAKNK